MAGGAHRGDHAAGEVVPAEEIGLELGAEQRGVKVFQCTGLGIGAVVDERIEPAARRRKHAAAAMLSASA
jgi:hypothetical protein